MNIYNGFNNIDPDLIKLFKTFKASKKDILLKLTIPASYKTIISSLKLNISMTLIGTKHTQGEKRKIYKIRHC